jgi:hypothetical protein
LSGRFVVPEGLDDGSQAIYCLEYAQERRPVPEGRCELGYTTYSPPMVENRPVDPITPFPTGRTLFYFGTRHFVPGYLRIVPSGQRTSTPAYEFDARSRQTERRLFEDEDDDEDEDD